MKRPRKTKDGYWITKSGTVVTPEVEEKWTKENEAGFDTTHWKRRPVGRPPLDGRMASERISIRVPRELYEAAEKKAEMERRSISNLTREALQRYVEE
ncbi:MAG TPA: ribbon-helix-helix domain-containing protein [Solirubrobacterales bacterium]|nr:ribbon-helix-helix domain-containing protein [Solirubrobacterales bacterium]